MKYQISGRPFNLYCIIKQNVNDYNSRLYILEKSFPFNKIHIYCVYKNKMKIIGGLSKFAIINYIRKYNLRVLGSRSLTQNFDQFLCLNFMSFCSFR
jgi:hypothetical protein